MMRGNLIHTNEILVSLGCSYFTKCSSKQAQQLIQHRSLKAEMHLKELEDERIFLNNQMEQSKDVFSGDCQEIIEPFDAREEEEWKQQHILNVRKSKKKENKDYSNIKHEDIMNKLELLELEEEIEQLHSKDIDKLQSDDVTIPKRKPSQSAPNQLEQNNTPKNESRESVIRKRLLELKKNKTKCVTEDDVLKRLDQLQEEEDLQDELESLCENNDIEEESEDTEDSTASEDSDYDNENSTLKYSRTDITTSNDSKQKSKRKISFADETVKSMKETPVLNFSHSDTPITKCDFAGDLKSPSDIYSLHPECFKKKPKSIIKNSHRVTDETHNIAMSKDKIETHKSKNESNSHEIIIGDIIEHFKVGNNTHPNEHINSRPVSKFKSMRMSSKQSTNLL